MNNLLAKKPIIIAGPCSAETEEQLLNTALALKKTNKIDLLRAGIWKPRTRPNSFEGVGEIGLPWLMEASKITGIPAITEVANAKHVVAALNIGLSHLWIGARTTVNPFAVQEIADAVKGSNCTIFIKNPINPDLNLWIGAIERVKNAGIENVHAIHRGFSAAKSAQYRNEPMWEIPLALKAEFPSIKLICDPSHIGGNRQLLKPISQKAMDLIYDGLMIETHLNPDQAWSDAKQQITPNNFDQLINELVLRNESIDNAVVNKSLNELRQQIDKIDSELIELIANRMKIAEEIGQYKKEHHLTILQPKRWEEIKRQHLNNGELQGLTSKFIDKYLEAIHQESIRHQTSVMNK